VFSRIFAAVEAEANGKVLTAEGVEVYRGQGMSRALLEINRRVLEEIGWLNALEKEERHGKDDNGEQEG
jgi:hypothetical protein